MIKNAEQFREEDAKKKEAIEMKNNLDSKIHNIEKTLKEHKEKLSQEITTEIETEITKSKEALTSEDADKIKEAYESLEKVSLKIGQAVYSQGQS